MQEIFEENGSEMLRGVIVWTPMLEADNLDAARDREARFPDPRVQHYWDPEHILGQILSQTLNLKAPIAWDVYLLYPPGHPWDSELPPAPELWMHQLDEEPALYLDPPHLKNIVRGMTEKSA